VWIEHSKEYCAAFISILVSFIDYLVAFVKIDWAVGAANAPRSGGLG